jgi:hypothetical protein
LYCLGFDRDLIELKFPQQLAHFFLSLWIGEPAQGKIFNLLVAIEKFILAEAPEKLLENAFQCTPKCDIDDGVLAASTG